MNRSVAGERQVADQYKLEYVHPLSFANSPGALASVQGTFPVPPGSKHREGIHTFLALCQVIQQMSLLGC